MFPEDPDVSEETAEQADLAEDAVQDEQPIEELTSEELDELNLVYEEWLNEENHSFQMMGLYDRSKGG